MKIGWWYNIVARKLVFVTDAQARTIDELRQVNVRLVDTNKDVVKKLNEISCRTRDWEERARLENSDGAIAAQVVRERVRSGEYACILTAREHAASQRIRDLEFENSKLRIASPALHAEITRLRAKLAKFNQR